MGESSQTDRDRLEEGYRRLHSTAHSSRWSLDNCGNRRSLSERLDVMESLAASRLPPGSFSVLDLGCGSLTLLPAPFQPGVVIGVDLLAERLRALRERGDETPTVLADGALLPFPDEVFDVVVMSTMLSSVLSEPARVAICRDVTRVLVPGGALLWYDFRVPSPGNSATRPIRRHQLHDYFPDLTGPVRSLTVVPPLARRLGRLHAVYPALARVPFLRTHLAACLVKTRLSSTIG